MPTSSYNKFNCFVADVHNKVHNMGSDTIKVALCAAANAPVATNTQLSNLTAASLTYLASAVITVSSSTQTSGTYSCVVADKTLTASGGSVGPFRYIVFYNDTSTNKSLICWHDYGSDITLADGESLAIDFDTTNNRLFTAS